MVQVTVEQAVSGFGKLLEEVGRGAEFVIMRGDALLACLSPVLQPCQSESTAAEKEASRFGMPLFA